MGINCSCEKLTGEAVIRWIKEAKKQVDNPSRYLANNRFMEDYIKPILDDAYNLVTKNNGLAYKVNFEADEKDNESISVDASVSMDEAIEGLVFGIRSQLNEGHSYVTGLGASSNEASAATYSETDREKAAVGVVITFLIGAFEGFKNAFIPQNQIGNMINSYYQTSMFIKYPGAGTLEKRTIESIQLLNEFSDGIEKYVHPTEDANIADECNLIYSPIPFYLLEGTILRVDTAVCDNGIERPPALYRTGGGGHIPSGLYKVVPEKNCKCRKEKRVKCSFDSSDSCSDSCSSSDEGDAFENSLIAKAVISKGDSGLGLLVRTLLNERLPRSPRRRRRRRVRSISRR